MEAVCSVHPDCQVIPPTCSCKGDENLSSDVTPGDLGFLAWIVAFITKNGTVPIGATGSFRSRHEGVEGLYERLMSTGMARDEAAALTRLSKLELGPRVRRWLYSKYGCSVIGLMSAYHKAANH